MEDRERNGFSGTFENKPLKRVFGCKEIITEAESNSKSRRGRTLLFLFLFLD